MNNDQFNERINELWAATKRGELPRQARFVAIEQLTEEYMAATDRLPDPALLDRLATLCLYEEVTDPNEHKMSQNEFPIMSDEQYARRTEGKYRRTDGSGKTEVSLKAAIGYGADGLNHARPIRKYSK